MTYNKLIYLIEINFLVSALLDDTFGGRFSHAADIAFGDTIIIVGGNRGNMLGDIIAFKVPTSIATNEVESWLLAFIMKNLFCPIGSLT